MASLGVTLEDLFDRDPNLQYSLVTIIQVGPDLIALMDATLSVGEVAQLNVDKHTNVEKAQLLLGFVKTKDDEAFDRLIFTLNKTKQTKAYKMLTKAMSEITSGGGNVGQGGSGPAGPGNTTPPAPTTPIQSKEEIETLATTLRECFRNHCTVLTGVDGIDYDGDLAALFIEWNIFTPRQRKDIAKTATDQPMYMIELLGRRTSVEVVLFTKALIQTDQGHLLPDSEREIVNAIPLKFCQELRNK